MRFKLVEDYQNDYIERTLKHIGLVNKYAEKIGKVYPEHDSDKFTQLFNGYSLMKKKKNKGGTNIGDDLTGLTDKEEDDVNKVTLIHISENKHHPEHWLDKKLKEFDRENPPLGLHCEKMPNEAIDEMMCDWCAVSEEMGNTPMEWLEKTVPERWIFTDAQVKYMKNRLKELWEE